MIAAMERHGDTARPQERVQQKRSAQRAATRTRGEDAESPASPRPPVPHSPLPPVPPSLRPDCPFCESSDTELVSLFGSQLLFSQYRCRACQSYFEAVRDDYRPSREET
jgi:hypothetical protein